MNLFTKQITNSQTQKIKLMVTKGEMGVREGYIQDLELNIHSTYIKYINNKNVLYGTRNYTQYLIIAYNEKESEKEYIYN